MKCRNKARVKYDKYDTGCCVIETYDKEYGWDLYKSFKCQGVNNEYMPGSVIEELANLYILGYEIEFC